MSSTNLISLQKNYLLHIIDSITTSNGFKYLVLDQTTENLINLLMEKHELLKHVTAIERIDQLRKPQLSIELVYFLEPTRYSINCLISDYSVQPNRYKRAHLILLPGMAKDVELLLYSNPSLKHNMATLQHAYLTMRPLEQQLFITNNVNALKVYNNPQCYDLVQKQIDNTVNCLINLCIVTGEYPMVRYYAPPSYTENGQEKTYESSALSKMIATKFQHTIDDYARNHDNFPPPDNPRPRPILVIVDRSLDIFAPILHEFTYQLMCFDLLDLHGNENGNYENEFRYEAENEKGELEEKSSKLNDNDPDWVSLRELHILDASETLVSKVNDLIVKNPLMVDRANATNTTDLLYIVAHLKDFDEERRRITVHKKLIDELLKINGERSLAELADFEQDCAANGINFEGEKVKGGVMAGNLLELLLNSCYKEGDKLRLILLYAIYRGGIVEKDLTKLLHFANLVELRPVVLSLFKSFENIGFPLLKPDLKSKKFKKPTLHQIDNEGSFNTSRFKPAMKEVIEKSVNDTLDETMFPYVKDKPLSLEESNGSATELGSSLKNPRHKATWAKSRLTNYVAPRQRFFYFVAGGLTYSELRTAYELSDSLNKDVIVGGDGLVSPRDFVNSMVELNADRRHLNLYLDQKAAMDLRKAPDHLFKVQATSLGKMASVNQPVTNKTQPVSQQGKPQLGARTSSSASTASSITASPDKKEKKRHKFTKFLR